MVRFLGDGGHFAVFRTLPLKGYLTGEYVASLSATSKSVKVASYPPEHCAKLH